MSEPMDDQTNGDQTHLVQTQTEQTHWTELPSPAESEPVPQPVPFGEAGAGLASEQVGPQTQVEPATLLDAPPISASEVIVSPGQAELAPVGLTPAPPQRLPRTPNFADFLLFLLLLVAGIIVAAIALFVALFAHAFGNLTLEGAKTDARFLLSFELVRYLVALAIAVPVFSLIWKRSYFSGLRWHGDTVRRIWPWLIGIAWASNLLAVLAQAVLPFPKHTPIEMLFTTPMQAWLMFGFGVLVAPFFEEMLFRGFMVPAMATAWDWCVERWTKSSPRPFDEQGNPTWSIAAMIFGAVTASVPFALMHAGQVSNAWGPLSVLFCVSLVLCAVRLRTKSLAASTLVHATYNFTLFAAMFVQTGGFQHLDKM